MRKLVVGTFLTLDGVLQGPGGPEEDRSGGFAHGGWLVPYFDDTMGHIMAEWIRRAGGFVLGRKPTRSLRPTGRTSPTIRSPRS